MIGAVAEKLAEPVAHALMALVGGGHVVGLVDDHEVPLHLSQTWKDLCPLGEIERGDYPLLLDPLVHAELVADVSAFEHKEFLVELLVKLALPLKGEIRRHDDEDAFGQSAQFELADQEAGHNRLACTSVIRE